MIYIICPRDVTCRVEGSKRRHGYCIIRRPVFDAAIMRSRHPRPPTHFLGYWIILFDSIRALSARQSCSVENVVELSFIRSRHSQIVWALRDWGGNYFVISFVSDRIEYISAGQGPSVTASTCVGSRAAWSMRDKPLIDDGNPLQMCRGCRHQVPFLHSPLLN